MCFKLKKTCCVCSLKSGAIFTAVVNLVASTTLLCITIVLLAKYEKSKKCQVLKDFFDEFFKDTVTGSLGNMGLLIGCSKYPYYLMITANSMNIIFSILLFIGALWKNAVSIFPFLFYHAVIIGLVLEGCLLAFLLSVPIMYYVIYYPADVVTQLIQIFGVHYIRNIFIVGAFTAGFLVVEFYLYLLVHSCFKDIRKSKKKKLLWAKQDEEIRRDAESDQDVVDKNNFKSNLKNSKLLSHWRKQSKTKEPDSSSTMESRPPTYWRFLEYAIAIID